MSDQKQTLSPANAAKWRECPDQDPYHRQRQAALRYLGDRYLLAKPINKRKTEHA